MSGVVTLGGMVQILSGSFKIFPFCAFWVTLAKVNLKGLRIYHNQMSKPVKFDLNSV